MHVTNSRRILRRTVMGALAGVLAATGATLLPSQVSAAEQATNGGGPVRATKGTAKDAAVKLATGDRLERIPGTKGFRVAAADGRPATGTYAFAQADGELTVRPIGTKKPLPATTVATDESGPGMSAYGATATQRVNFSVAGDRGRGGIINLWNTSTWTWYSVNSDQYVAKGTADVPPGTYFATIQYDYYGETRPAYLLTKTFTVGNTTANAVFDETAAKPMGIVADDTSARRAGAAVWLTTPNGDAVGQVGGGADQIYVTPFTLSGATVHLHDVLTKYGSSQLKPSPYRYDLVHQFRNTVPANPVVTVKTAGLAKTVTTFRSQAGRQTARLDTWRITSEISVGAQAASTVTAPGTLTEYVTPNVPFGRSFWDGDSYLTLADRTLPAGTSAGETIGQGPLQPRTGNRSTRIGGQIRLYEPHSYSDAAGNEGRDSSAVQQYRLTSRGVTLVDSPYEKGYVNYAVGVTSAAAPYEFTHTTIRRGPHARLSTKLVREWTFSSGGTSPVPRLDDALPLLDVTFDVPALDIRNTAPAGTVRVATTVTSRWSTATGSFTGLEYSADDGKTWLPASAEGDITVGAADRFVSLRATGKDDSGGTVRTTLIRAFGGPGSVSLPDESAGDVRISRVKVNGNNPIVVDGALGQFELSPEASFTATSPAGIARGGMTLYKGSYESPDAVIPLLWTTCTPANGTAASCKGNLNIAPRHLADNALAGAWKVAVWAESQDGTSYADVHAAQTVRIVRTTRLTTDATPEPVTKGATLTVTGRFTVTDWLTGGQLGHPQQRVNLEFRRSGSTDWTRVGSAVTDSTGKAAVTLKATYDGEYRWIGGPSLIITTAGPALSPDTIDVR
ncbi:hypothetical protein Q5762_28820 [Streptomyces sp. P9(2023)]|uniref:hypothetical protein n=1 Tax=Streptomyces sp. P9(2023) TaxID=3064394 RepID=UPI0028F4155E|nr:hypothetical protein [Streptomyces sp. P9(2023)]MDT9692261.1 hypothetical protein [Streptomyces sp. P9(2023)]